MERHFWIFQMYIYYILRVRCCTIIIDWLRLIAVQQRPTFHICPNFNPPSVRCLPLHWSAVAPPQPRAKGANICLDHTFNEPDLCKFAWIVWEMLCRDGLVRKNIRNIPKHKYVLGNVKDRIQFMQNNAKHITRDPHDTIIVLWSYHHCTILHYHIPYTIIFTTYNNTKYYSLCFVRLFINVYSNYCTLLLLCIFCWLMG